MSTSPVDLSKTFPLRMPCCAMSPPDNMIRKDVRYGLKLNDDFIWVCFRVSIKKTDAKGSLNPPASVRNHTRSILLDHNSGGIVSPIFGNEL